MDVIQYFINNGTSTAETAVTILLFPQGILIFFLGLMLFTVLLSWILHYPLKAFRGNLPRPK